MEIKEMVERARKAQVIYDERFDQERVDQVIKLPPAQFLTMQKNWHDLRLMKPKWVFTKTK